MPDLGPDFLLLIRISDPAHLGPESRPTRFPRSSLGTQLDSWFARHQISSELQPPLRTAALLWHDHLDDAHALAQEIPTTTGSYLHAIMHRREPDFDNARYWFHRVGKHESFYALARAVTPFLLRQGEPQLASRLLPNGLWNPFVFVDACAEVHRQSPSAPPPSLLREIQRMEFESLLLHLLTPG